MDLFLRASYFMSANQAEKEESVMATARQLLRGVISWEEAKAWAKDKDITEAELEDAIDNIVRG